MTKTMSDLTEDLVAEILSRVPITSLGAVRSTCKGWNALSRQRIFGEVAKSRNHILGFMVKDFKICSVRIDLEGINNNGVIDLSIKHVSFLNRINVMKVYHCDGLLLCRLDGSLLIWNPYLGQKRWIQHIFNSFDSFVLGYDNNRNHKILQILDYYEDRNRNYVFGFKIYEFSSNSWRVLDVSPKWRIPVDTHVTLKGNTYFYALEKMIIVGEATKIKESLVCFDFTSERFGPCLPLPFQSYSHGAIVTLSCVKSKKLAVLYNDLKTPTILEIWVTKKIDYNEVLWTKWMEVDVNLFSDFPTYYFSWSFSIDEENKVIVVFNISWNQKCSNQTAHIIGQDGYFKSIDFGEPSIQRVKPYFIGYFPSLVQIE